MAAPPAFRTGYMSILLPVETGEGEVRRIIREVSSAHWPLRANGRYALML